MTWFSHDSLHRKPRVHFSGIGGTAMVGGARLAVEAGWEVHGSDNPLYPPTSAMVEALGVPVATGYNAANLDWGPDLVVIGNALSRGNPEVEAALERRLPYTSLPEWLKETVLRSRRPIAICGTHGKTTTAAITAFLLDRTGFEPGFLIGGQSLDFPHPARLNPEGGPFVIEGDEYDTAFFDKRAKFFHYLPEIAVVTSIEFDHGDIYPNLDAIEQAFRLMLRQVPRSGWLVVCADHPLAAALADHAPCQVLTYGLSDRAAFRGEPAGSSGDWQEFVVYRKGRKWGEFAVPLSGRHNLLNALAALAVADLLGASPDLLREALPTLKGVRRRMEVFHEAEGVTFVDDFAHHPTAIRETIAAARARWPRGLDVPPKSSKPNAGAVHEPLAEVTPRAGRRLLVACEPRSNTMVTNRFQGELVEVFTGADEVWIGPIYRAERIDREERLDRARLVKELIGRGVPAHFSDSVEEIVNSLRNSARAGDVVLVLSNGAFDGIYDRLRKVFPHSSCPVGSPPA